MSLRDAPTHENLQCTQQIVTKEYVRDQLSVTNRRLRLSHMIGLTRYISFMSPSVTGAYLLELVQDM